MEGNAPEVSLKSLSKVVADKIKVARISTPREIANSIVTNYSSRSENKTFVKSLNRRIYDVINVLSALGFVEKDDKSIKWIDNPSLIKKDQEIDPAITKAENRIMEKEENLRNKVRQLLLYKCLIELNKNTSYEGPRVSLPMTIVCFQNLDFSINVQDKHLIDITSTTEPTFITQLDILSLMKFPVKLIRHVISCSPEIVSCQKYLPFSDEGEDPDTLVSF